MPRGRKKKFKLKFNISTNAARSLLAVLLFILWLLSFISFFAPDYSLNEKIYSFWTSWFGGIAFFAPMALLLGSIFLIESIKSKFKEPRILIGVLLMYAAVIGLAHVFIPAEKAYDVAAEGSGGGMLGYMLSAALIGSVSKAGAVVVLLGGVAIASIIIFNINLDAIVIWMNEKVLPNLAGIKGAFGKLAKRDGKADMEFSTDTGMEDGDEEPAVTPAFAEAVVQKSAPADTDASFSELDFQIVPSPSEPSEEAVIIDNTSLATLIPPTVEVPSLPYVDRIWKNPPLDLLADYADIKSNKKEQEESAKKITDTLKSFDIEAHSEDADAGPSVTRFKLKVDSGIRVAKIANLQTDIATALASPTGSVRVEAPIPGTALIGIEVPNKTRVRVGFRSLMSSDVMKDNKSKTAVVLGKDVGGKVFVHDLARMPHMLVAGTTGSGKSIFIHNIIFSILFRASPQEVKLILIDPKRVELSHYRDIPHLVTPVVTDMSKAPAVLTWAVEEMNRRTALFESAHVQNIDGYNEKAGFQALNYIVIVVEEFGEMMQVDRNGVEKNIIRIGQLARAAGIHMVLSIQRPSADVVTGLIKANIPCRVAFNVASSTDSRVIIDMPGAEKLLGKGDMLFVPPESSKPFRLQGAYIDNKEITALVNYIKSQGFPTEYKDDEIFKRNDPGDGNGLNGSGGTDTKYEEARELVILRGKASTTLLQTKLGLGYARAARIIEELEENGVIAAAEGNRPREVLIKPEDLYGGHNVSDPEIDSLRV